MTFDELLGVSAALTVIGGLAVAFALAPSAGSATAGNYRMSAAKRALRRKRKLSRRIGFSGTLFGRVVRGAIS